MIRLSDIVVVRPTVYKNKSLGFRSNEIVDWVKKGISMWNTGVPIVQSWPYCVLGTFTDTVKLYQWTGKDCDVVADRKATNTTIWQCSSCGTTTQHSTRIDLRLHLMDLFLYIAVVKWTFENILAYVKWDYVMVGLNHQRSVNKVWRQSSWTRIVVFIWWTFLVHNSGKMDLQKQKHIGLCKMVPLCYGGPKSSDLSIKSGDIHGPELFGHW